jgi:BirA family biotin operon repressor/biotin-[acetyl-CoA-carboxylase] ligase
MPSPINKEEIAFFLGTYAEKTEILIYSEIDSTNSEARRRVCAGEQKPTLILAEQQTNGRGRMGRNYFSPAGAGIYMTYLWHPEAKPVDVISVTTAISVAVVRALKSFSSLSQKQFSIKWVNDILLDGKKVCGILTEAMSDPEKGKITDIWVGIGINVYSTAFPPELSEIATSLNEVDLNRNELIARILIEFLDILNHTDPYAHMSYYRACSAVIGKRVNTISADISTPGTVLDIDATGGLVVERLDGTIETIHSGEISLRF